ncbi:MAG: FAD-binding oxidoreductase [Candidatus Korarchaeota archaeon]|nr:FAD-binding oxidoreductase [Candidatus Korarchaeota archaeon]NIU84521.1 FAD-dependent oxidoreductase [Candidatus Thorarchaeota archaeon]NIW14588.1 FAD-dependent oxidoreductase [Candidatus Thorarchaeota archaeon]NIW52660.1 FAD-dependent oxidoreductase [Candidatus Korarchaeota archaeon]
MKEEAEVVVVGGGVNGTTIAYNLTKREMDVALFEKDFLSSGATGRSGAGIRQQFATRENIKLAKRSVEIFEQLSDELDRNLDYRQGGYLIPVHSEEEGKDFEDRIKLQNEMGVESRWLELEEVHELVPELNIENIGAIGASWCPSDGYIDPFKLTLAYAENAEDLGAKIYTHTKVNDILVHNGEIVGVKTEKGTIKTNTVVAAAGAWTRDIAAMVGLELPNYPERHEIYVTDKLEHFLDPMIIDFHDNIYFHQAEAGGIFGGWGGYAPKAPDYNTDTSLKFLKNFSRLLVKYIPKLSEVNILRQWAGFYDVTPDAKPILGKTDVKGFIVVCGFSGHGLMISPATGELITELITEGRTSMPDVMEDLSLERFKKGKVEREKGVVG